jgi:hypothetical protein
MLGAALGVVVTGVVLDGLESHGRSWPMMGLLVATTMLILLDVAAWLWGHDSRDGRDW